MKIQKDEVTGCWELHFSESTFAHTENDWKQLLGDFNWKTYRVADINFEDDVMFGGKEFTFVLFGLGFRIRHNNLEDENMKELVGRAESVTKKQSK